MSRHTDHTQRHVNDLLKSSTNCSPCRNFLRFEPDEIFDHTLEVMAKARTIRAAVLDELAELDAVVNGSIPELPRRGTVHGRRSGFPVVRSLSPASGGAVPASEQPDQRRPAPSRQRRTCCHACAKRVRRFAGHTPPSCPPVRPVDSGFLQGCERNRISRLRGEQKNGFDSNDHRNDDRQDHHERPRQPAGKAR